MINDGILNNAIDQYGLCVVEEVKRMVDRTTIEDMIDIYVDRKMFIHLDCLELLYLK